MVRLYRARVSSGGGCPVREGDFGKRRVPGGLFNTLATIFTCNSWRGWLVSRVVSVPDSGAEGPGFKSQSRRCRVTVLGKLLTPIVPLFTKQQNW